MGHPYEHNDVTFHELKIAFFGPTGVLADLGVSKPAW